MLDIYFLSTNIIEVYFLRRKKKKQFNGPLRMLISKRHQLYCKGFFNVC